MRSAYPPVAQLAAHPAVQRRERRSAGPGFPRKEEPVLAGFQLTPTAPADEVRRAAGHLDGLLHP